MHPLPIELPRGPLMIDIAGFELTDLDRERLRHPLVGGLILFARNYQSPEQLAALCAQVHALRTPQLLITIDHEGGRVQRCREGFTRLPAMRKLGELYAQEPAEALDAARDIGYVLAVELRRNGVDLSFTPVLDLDWGRASVVGDRSFSGDPEVVIALAGALIEGLRRAGMACCGKHFPGHGWANADSHVALPVDPRPYSEIATDLEPYRRLKLDAVMPAHVVYPQVDARPAGFSPVWIGKLRDGLGANGKGLDGKGSDGEGFDGVIFSDDLSMHGASLAGDAVGRVAAAWDAGCDLLLLCNSPESVGDVLARWQPVFDLAREAARTARVSRLLPKTPLPELSDDARYQAGVKMARRLTA